MKLCCNINLICHHFNRWKLILEIPIFSVKFYILFHYQKVPQTQCFLEICFDLSYEIIFDKFYTNFNIIVILYYKNFGSYQYCVLLYFSYYFYIILIMSLKYK